MHSGREVTVRLAPRPEAAGIVFRRVDLADQPEIPVSPESLAPAGWCTTLRSGEAEIQTPEHLLATLSALGVSSARVEMDSAEVPILDGSAAPFAELVRAAGVQSAAAAPPELALERVHWVDDGEAHVLARPATEFRVTYCVDYGKPLAPKQVYDGRPLGEEFVEQIAQARTFALAEWIQDLWDRGLATGGSLDNAVVIWDDRLSSELRFPDEFVRHKTLDLLGDLAALARPVRAHIIALKSSHALNAQLVSELHREYGKEAQ